LYKKFKVDNGQQDIGADIAMTLREKRLCGCVCITVSRRRLVWRLQGTVECSLISDNGGSSWRLEETLEWRLEETVEAALNISDRGGSSSISRDSS